MRFLKNKKLLAFVAISLVVLSIAGAAFAAEDAGQSPVAQCGWSLAIIPCILGNYVAAMFWVVNAVLSLLIYGLGLVIEWLITMSGELFYLHIVQVGFKICLSITNMLFVLAIIFAAFRLILGFSNSHETNSFIKNLIIAAIMVNFSFLIAGLLLDVTNVFIRFFGQGVTSETLGSAFQVNTSTGFLPKNLDSSGGQIGLFMNIIFYSVIKMVMNSVVLIAFVAITVMLAVRNLWVIFLLITMPLIWGFWVFPSMKKHWDKWWDDFLNWGVMFMPTAMFFLWLAVTSSSKLLEGGTALKLPAGQSWFGQLFFSIFGFIIDTTVLVGLIIYGLKQAKEAGATGAGIGMSMAKSVGAKAGQFVGRRAARFGAGVAGGAANKLGTAAGWAGGVASRASKIPGLGLLGNITGFNNAISRRVAGLASGAAQSALRTGASSLGKLGKEDEDIEQIKKEQFDGMTPKQFEEVNKDSLNDQELAAYASAREEKEKQGANVEFTDGQLERLTNSLKKSNPGTPPDKIEILSDLVKKMPDKSHILTRKDDGTFKEPEEIYAKLKGSELADLDLQPREDEKGTPAKEAAYKARIDTMLKSLTQSQLAGAATTGERERIIRRGLAEDLSASDLNIADINGMVKTQITDALTKYNTAKAANDRIAMEESMNEINVLIANLPEDEIKKQKPNVQASVRKYRYMDVGVGSVGAAKGPKRGHGGGPAPTPVAPATP